MRTRISGLFLAAVLALPLYAQAQPLDPAAAIGQRFWTSVFASLAPCPAVLCPNYEFGDTIRPGTGFTLLGIFNGMGGPLATFVQVRLDDGRVGFFLCCGPWDTQDPEAKTREYMAGVQRRLGAINALVAKERADREALREEERRCAAGWPQIGMTREEARRVWCEPWTVNTTETARGLLEQWVYRDRGYLYFDDGRLVAIQRN
jgi:hypothetical protein